VPGAGAAAAISVHGLRMRYGDRDVLKGIDLEVHSGEVFGFLGPNGAGKTTTIEILEGYRKRSGGEVSVLGVDPARADRRWRERVGFVLQECELDPLLTVTEILRLFATFYRSPRPVAEVIERVGLSGHEKDRLGTLSGGQRRRADVAVALIGDPELIFLDEPTTGFDPSARREAWKTIAGLRELGKTIVLTTHYMDEAQHLSDRVAIIRDGTIIAQGTPGELGEHQGAAVISFERPGEVAPERIASEVRVEPTADGNRVSFEVEDPQPALLRLLTWANREGLALEGLEVRRPTLEDVFLELTATEERQDGESDG
jgi:ABC-2 type transport system ATP-binding protein